MSIGETWEVFDERRNAWRPAKIINELANQVELQFQDAPDEPELAKTFSTTREAMQDQRLYRVPSIEYRGYDLTPSQHSPGWQVHITPLPGLVHTHPRYVTALTKEDAFAKARQVVDDHLS